MSWEIISICSRVVSWLNSHSSEGLRTYVRTLWVSVLLWYLAVRTYASLMVQIREITSVRTYVLSNYSFEISLRTYVEFSYGVGVGPPSIIVIDLGFLRTYVYSEMHFL